MTLERTWVRGKCFAFLGLSIRLQTSRTSTKVSVPRVIVGHDLEVKLLVPGVSFLLEAVVPQR